MAITDFFKNKIDNVSPNSDITEQKQHDDRESSQINMISSSIELALVDAVEYNLQQENIFYKIEKNDKNARLRIDKKDTEQVQRIIANCREELKNNSQRDTNEQKKPPLDTKIKDGKNKIDSEKNDKQNNYYSIEINPELEAAMKIFVENENIQYTLFEENGKTYIGFWGYDNGEIILKHYTKLNELAKTYTDKAREEESDIELNELNKETPASNAKPKKEKKTKSTRQVLGRSEQMKARFTPDEMKIIQDKISSSQKKQGDYIREMLLNGYVKAHPAKLSDAQLIIQELQNMNAQLGKLTGATVKIMQRTKDNPSLTKEDREFIQFMINDTKKIRNEIRKALKELWQ